MSCETNCNCEQKQPIVKIDILGTEYVLTETTGKDDPRLANADGWCGSYEKQILIEKDIFVHEQGGDIDNSKIKRSNLIKRHEIIHAYFNESGLDDYSNNEQLVTWIARQFPKLLKTFNEIDAL